MSKAILQYQIGINSGYLANNNNISRPLESAYGISTEIDRTIMGLEPELILQSCHEIQSYLDMRLSHAYHILPRETLMLFKRIFSTHRDGWLCPTSRALDLKNIPGKLIHDITSTPRHCFQLIAKIERGRAEDRILEDVLDSLEQATASIFLMLVKRCLETQDSLKKKILSPSGFGVFLALGMLFEAYGSRLASTDTLYLTSGHRLEREHCSGLALTYFDEVYKLKEYILSVPEQIPWVLGAEIKTWDRLLERILPTLNALLCPTHCVEESYINDHPHWLGLISVLHNAANSLPDVIGAVRFEHLLERF
jgi:hypothetical protein